MATGAARNAAAAGDPVAAAHARLLHDPSLQFDFTAVPRPPPTPQWLIDLGKLLGALAPFFKLIFWVVLGLAVAALAAFLIRELIRLRWPEFGRKRKPKPPVADWRPDEARARALLEDADRLAAEGRYDEAVHVLLFRSIEDIQGRKPHLLKPALTSRDIAGLDGVPGRARDSFASIAEAVERSFFGGRPVDADGFAHCRAAYEAFAFPEAWA